MSKQRTAGKQSKQRDRSAGNRPSSKQRRSGRRPVKSKPVRRRTGFAGMRRSRRQHLGIAAAAVGTLAVIWLFTDWRLAIGLSALVLLVLPAFVVLTMGRRY